MKVKRNKITKREIPNENAFDAGCEILGPAIAISLEVNAFNLARYLSKDYDGGLWSFYSLKYGGYFMAPPEGQTYSICCPNGYEGSVSSEVFGVIICLYLYSAFCAKDDQHVRATCSTQYYLLLDYARTLDCYHTILDAID